MPRYCCVFKTAKCEHLGNVPVLLSPVDCLSLHSGKHSEVKKLLEAGLDWDWSDDDGCTLYAAAATRDVFVVASATSHSCVLHCRYTAFLAACEGGNQKVVPSN
jgi:hypothetical protein